MVRAASAPVAMIPLFCPICDAVAGMCAELSLHTCARSMVPSPHAEAAALSAGSRYNFALICSHVAAPAADSPLIVLLPCV